MDPFKKSCDQKRNEKYDKTLNKDFPVRKIGNHHFQHINHPLSTQSPKLTLGINISKMLLLMIKKASKLVCNPEH